MNYRAALKVLWKEKVENTKRGQRLKQVEQLEQEAKNGLRRQAAGASFITLELI